MPHACSPHSPAYSFPSSPAVGSRLLPPKPEGSPPCDYPALHHSFQRELQSCDTDDDVAMCFIKNQAAFEQYLAFLVGRVQAESAVVSPAVQEFYKVPPPGPLQPCAHLQVVTQWGRGMAGLGTGAVSVCARAPRCPRPPAPPLW